MRNRLAVFILIGCLVSPMGGNGQTIESPRQVTVRLYAAQPPAGADLTVIAAVARDLLAGATVDSRWLECSSPSARKPPPHGLSVESPCDRPLQVNELAVRFVRERRPPEPTGTVPLGDSFVDTQTHAGTLATIYADRITRLASSAGVDVNVLFGRAVAHELGHLLLGTTEHRDIGLMRAVWTGNMLRDDPAGAWGFSAIDIMALHRRMVTAEQVRRER